MVLPMFMFPPVLPIALKVIVGTEKPVGVEILPSVLLMVKLGIAPAIVPTVRFPVFKMLEASFAFRLTSGV